MCSPLISVVFPLGFYNLGGRIWGRRWWRLQEMLETLWGTCRISESLGDSLQRQNGEVHRSLATPWKWRFAMCNRDGHLLSKWKLESKKYLGIHTVSDKKIEPVHFCKKIAFWLFGFSLVKLRKIHFFTYQKILLSSRAFQISGFRQERVNRSGDMCSRSRIAFTHPTSEKLIAGLKLAIIA